jgi:hypothetical protein
MGRQNSAFEEVRRGGVSHPLPRALRPLAYEPVVTEDGPRPLTELGAVAIRWSVIVLAGRATRMPQGAVTSGIQRSITVTPR